MARRRASFGELRARYRPQIRRSATYWASRMGFSMTPAELEQEIELALWRTAIARSRVRHPRTYAGQVVRNALMGIGRRIRRHARLMFVPELHPDAATTTDGQAMVDTLDEIEVEYTRRRKAAR